MNMLPRVAAICFAYGVAVAVPALPVLAVESTVTPLTIERVKSFLSAAGLQVCEVSTMDPIVPKLNNALVSLSVAVATDCRQYDPTKPTVINVHQFSNQQDRDAMVGRYQGLRYRALAAYGSVWAVEDYVIVVFGPNRAETEGLIRAEYKRRHPDEL